MLKRMISIVMIAALASFSAISLSSCGEENKTETPAATEATEASTEASTEAPTKAEKTVSADLKPTKGKVRNTSPGYDVLKDMKLDLSMLDVSPKVNYAEGEKFGFQLKKPKKGSQIAVIHTDKGDITLRFFPEYAPNTVKNFIELAKAGKYDGVLFHRVMDNFMIQTGDYENNNGTGGTSIYGEAFEDEFCDKLVNIRGSVAMANSGKDTNGSQFFINQCPADEYNEKGTFSTYESYWESLKSQLEQYKDDPSAIANVGQYGTRAFVTEAVPKKLKTLYKENGGNPWLDGAYNAIDCGHTVFAQVIEGMDVVDKIAAVKVDSSSKPTKDITIKSIDIKKY